MEHEKLAESIRTFLVESASSQPGLHLASALGLADFAVALSEVFDWKQDELIFDIGHQRYPFDIVSEYRNYGRLAFSAPSNTYDFFRHPGFAGLSISMAFARARTNNGWTIALVGDGALGAGQLFEALNHSASGAKRVLIILNENRMSIQDTPGYLFGTERIQSFAGSLGLSYQGPVDGHDIAETVKQLKVARSKYADSPSLFHITTVKGKGYQPAEQDPLAFHQPFYPFDRDTGEFIPSANELTDTFLNALKQLDSWLVYLVSEKPDLLATVPATPPLFALRDKYPGSLIDTGICEQHCMTLSTALSLEHNTVLCMFSTFTTRCYSQIMDLGHLRAPLTCVLFFPGINPLGSTHQALHVIGQLRSVPNLVLLQPYNLNEYGAMLSYAAKCREPTFILTPKHDPVASSSDIQPLVHGRGTILISGGRVTILPIGSCFQQALMLAQEHEGVELINPRFLKPLDYDLISKSVRKTGRLLIIEDGFEVGGVGQEIVSCLAQDGLNFNVQLVAAKNISDHSGDFSLLQKKYGLSIEDCYRALSRLLSE